MRLAIDLHDAVGVMSRTGAPQGNARDKALRKLRISRPDLHREVLAGDKSPHAAMIEAGFRQRTVQLYPDDIERTIDILLRHCSEENLDLLLSMLRAARGSLL